MEYKNKKKMMEYSKGVKGFMKKMNYKEKEYARLLVGKKEKSYM